MKGKRIAIHRDAAATEVKPPETADLSQNPPLVFLRPMSAAMIQSLSDEVMEIWTAARRERERRDVAKMAAADPSAIPFSSSSATDLRVGASKYFVDDDLKLGRDAFLAQMPKMAGKGRVNSARVNVGCPGQPHGKPTTPAQPPTASSKGKEAPAEFVPSYAKPLAREGRPAKIPAPLLPSRPQVASHDAANAQGRLTCLSNGQVLPIYVRR